MKRTACVLLLALTLLGVSSCDQNPFGDETDPGNIYSPAIDHLVISRNSVYCGNGFSMTFNFDDKQGDIDFVRVMIIGPRSSALLDEEVDWTIASDVLQGSATVSQSIPCSSDFPSGEYSISVRLVDSKNHVSNQAAGSITLL